ncbi:MAG TPA: helix-turn-helix transcriptional regulator [Polyangiaceae bacterium]|jgi:DNA-binding CsgD family transcriptional regulator
MSVAVVRLMQEQTLFHSAEDSFEMAELWRRLVGGQLFVSSSYCAAGRCFAELETRHGPLRPASRLVKNLERVFLGTSQKVLVHELGVTNATIATGCARALSTMTNDQLVSRAPILIVMAAHAAHGAKLEPARVDAQLEGTRRLISCVLPGASLATRLTPCEFAVARLLIEGKTHVEIAAARGTAMRTTANQLASIFSKLGVSGRGELRSKAIAEASSSPALGNAAALPLVRSSVRRAPPPADCQELTHVAVLM